MGKSLVCPEYQSNGSLARAGRFWERKARMDRRRLELIDRLDARSVVVAGGVDLFGYRIADQIGQKFFLQNLF